MHMLLHHLKLARSCLTRVCCNFTINCRRSTICQSTTSATTGRQLLGLASWVAGCLSDSTVFASKRFVCHPLLNSLILGASFLMVIETTASKNAHTLPSKDCRDCSSPVVCQSWNIHFNKLGQLHCLCTDWLASTLWLPVVFAFAICQSLIPKKRSFTFFHSYHHVHNPAVFQ